MTRQEAEALVSQYVHITTSGFLYVEHDDAKAILGERWFASLTHDPIRHLGPKTATVYPWNVVDYLVMTSHD